MLWQGRKNEKEKPQVLENEDGVSPLESPGRTWSNGPSEREPALITSSWTIGWQTPVLMVTCYALAILIAIGHFTFFRYLDGRQASGINQAVPQAYVTTASNILANAFGFSLRAALATAFAQHLWYLLRVETMKVSTIELLYSIRTNFFMLFMPVVLKATPLLSLLAIVMWASQVVTSFPPGSITVTTAQMETYEQVVVPSFNASFMGNASGLDANRYSLVNLTPYLFGFVNGGSDSVKDGNILNRLARQTLIAGQPLTMSSPCGANCSYVTEFEGPWFNCNTTRSEFVHADASKFFSIYAANWSAPMRPDPLTRYNGTYTLAKFNSTTLLPLEANGTSVSGGNTSVRLQRDETICSPGRAKYTVNHVWRNNILQRNSSAEPIETLRNTVLRTYELIIAVGGFADADPDRGFFLGSKPADWSPDTLALYRDNNMMAIFTAVMSNLAGEYLGFLAPGGFAPALRPGNFTSYEMAWNEIVRSQNSGRTLTLGALDGTLAEGTRFNTASGKYSAFERIHPSFNVTEKLLNEYMLNMTTSMMTAYGNWNTSTNATRLTTINVYSFSEPLNLIIPYFATLLVSLPFIILGGIALWKNGVSAIDNSFIQTLTTSTGSAALDKAAAGGCLGGSENVPKELKDLKIRFGEIIDRDEPGRIKRAAFGVEGEVTSLTKGASYGIARWL